MYNGLLVRADSGVPVKVEPKCDKSQLVAVPTIYDLLHQAGKHSAAIDWPCTRNAESLDDNFPDVPDPLANTTPRLRTELVAEGILPDETEAAFHSMTGPGRDEVWTRAACLVIEKRRPEFLMLHLLNTDGIHHRYGPESSASYTALALADSYVGRLLDSLEHAGIRQNTTVFVLADHGFAVATNVLRPNVLLRQAGLLEIGSSNQIVRATAQMIPEGGTGMIYLTNPQTRDADRRNVVGLLQGKEGLAELIDPEQAIALGWPSPVLNRRTPDLILAARRGYAFDGTASGDAFVVRVTGTMNEGYHGYLANNPDMDALFLVAGRGVKHHLKIGLVDNIDVAPTMGYLLGCPLPGTDGKVLSEILVP
jgi:predicted AlkP superfamily pyrophosphatase or phosphodiesterase